MNFFTPSGEAIRNRSLFQGHELEEIQEFLKIKIRSYINAREEYEREWEKWNRALQCVYNESDHCAKTDSKMFDNETTDAIDTLVKRFGVAIFSSEKISKLVWDDYYEEEKKDIANKIWDSIVAKLDMNKKLPPILRSGTAFGTFLIKTYYEEKETYKYKTVTGSDGSRIRQAIKDKISKPVIKFVSLPDLILDPTAQYLEDSEVVTEKCLVSNDTLKDDKYFMQDNIVEYELYSPRYVTPGVGTTEEVKKQILYDSGIDVDQLMSKNMRAIYHVYFNWKDDEDIEMPIYAVVDCASGNIIRIEASPYDGYIPYVATHYISRNDTFYGIGVSEQAWPTQIALNDTMNQYLDNIDLINEMNLLTMDGDSGVAANKPVIHGRFKFIPVMNPQNVVHVKNNALPNVDVMVRHLRENLQKKTKATLTLQGQPLEGNRTATETEGIFNEINSSIKDIILHLMNDFLKPILENIRLMCVQFYNDDEIVLKVPSDNSGTRFSEVTYSFDDFREMFEKANVKIVGVEEATIKNNKLMALQNLLTMGLQVPNFINIPKLMEKIYYEYYGFEDYDEFMAFTVPMRNKPMAPDRENQILSAGTPINTSDSDDHNAHIQAHSDFYNKFMQDIKNMPREQATDEMMSLADDVLMNTYNHINEHLKEVQRLNNNTATQTVV